MKDLTCEWINKAEKDFLISEREIKVSEPVWDAICFHSQQCVEKYIKAILIEDNIYFEKTHDLWHLAKKCLKIIPELEKMKENLIMLSEYAVEIRYPGVDATKEDAEKSFLIAKELRKIVRDYFGLEVVE